MRFAPLSPRPALRIGRPLLALSLAAALAVPPAFAQEVPVPASAPAVPPTPGGGDDIVGGIKLAEDSLDQVLALVEQFTGRTLLRPAALPATTYTIKINQPLTRSEALLAIETLLAMNGIGLTPMGDKFIKVVPLAQLRTEAPLLIEGSALEFPPSGRLAAKVYQFGFLRTAEAMQLVTPLLNPNLGGAVVFEKANAALITDSISNHQRIEILLEKLDAPAPGLTTKFYPLKFAKASDLVGKLSSILSKTAATIGAATSYSADDRTNQVILVSDEREQPFFADLIAKLDVQADPNTRNEVIPLKNAAAKDVATLLSQLISGKNSASRSAGAADAARAAGQRGANGQVTPQLPTADGQPQPPQPNQPATVDAATASVLGERSADFSQLLTVIADERSNSIVVSGTVDDIRLIRDLIDKIDIILAQVRIEVVIAEINLNENSSSGLNTVLLNIENSKITGFNAGVAGASITGPVSSQTTDEDGNPITNALASITDAGRFNLSAAITPLAGNSDVKILSAPTIVTTHNKEARIVVGQSVPIVTQTQSDLSTGGNTNNNSTGLLSNVQYRDIALELTVTPLIGSDGNIQLTILQKVDDILNQTTIGGNSQPIIGRREAESFVNVGNGQMVVLGGLQRNRSNNSKQRFGFFYEIPILGSLLGPKTKSSERSELLLFIRPTIITPEATTADVYQQIEKLRGKEAVLDHLDPNFKTAEEKKAEAPKDKPRQGPRR